MSILSIIIIDTRFLAANSMVRRSSKSKNPVFEALHVLQLSIARGTKEQESHPAMTFLAGNGFLP
jgi:hypothetical protein